MPHTRLTLGGCVGNPPWLTYAGVSNGDYQNLLRTLSDHYRVTPENRANFPHLEIAAIFLAHAVNYFMKRSGTLAFVLPRSLCPRTSTIRAVRATSWDCALRRFGTSIGWLRCFGCHAA